MTIGILYIKPSRCGLKGIFPHGTPATTEQPLRQQSMHEAVVQPHNTTTTDCPISLLSSLFAFRRYGTSPSLLRPLLPAHFPFRGCLRGLLLIRCHAGCATRTFVAEWKETARLVQCR